MAFDADASNGQRAGLQGLPREGPKSALYRSFMVARYSSTANSPQETETTIPSRVQENIASKDRLSTTPIAAVAASQTILGYPINFRAEPTNIRNFQIFAAGPISGP